MEPDPNGAGAAPDAAVGVRVRAARMQQGVSLRALARSLGVSPATMSQLENGRTRLTVVRLSEIAAALGTTVQDVLDSPVDRGHATDRPRMRAATRRDGETAASPTSQEAHMWRIYPPLTFDVVLDAALQEFLATGYHGSSVRDIARGCGMSVSGLYHHYASKQEMLARILDLTMTDLLWRSRAARAQGRNPVERFSLLIECLALFHTRRRELGFVGASEMRSLERRNRRRIAEMRTTQQRMVDEEVDAGVTQGRFGNRRPHDAARAVVTMCTALPQWFRIDGPLTPEEIAAQYVEFALDLLRHRPGEFPRHTPPG
ncbi:MAG: TetR family transcriptional regulator [Pseudonocardiaceae bacterium]|nr:TetR family transcriptional regulator [Pseudonocardiaceae bacterium]